MFFIAIEDVLIFTSLGIGIISLGIGFINAILYYFQYRRNKIHIEKIRTKKRLFREWYERTKDLTDRMEIVDKKDISTHTVFNYKIRKKNRTDYEEPTTQFVLNVRINNVVEDIKSVCGIESKKFEGIEKENQGKIELIRTYPVKKTMDEDSITYPNDMLPRDYEEIKNDLKNQVILFAKENGINERYLKNIPEKFSIFKM